MDCLERYDDYFVTGVDFGSIMLWYGSNQKTSTRFEV